MLARRLQIGDTLGIVSPSLPILPEQQAQFDAGIGHLQDLGFRTVLGNYIHSNTTGYGATPRERAADINRMFADDNIQGIICSQGGVNANGCLPYLDWELIRTHPKIFTGISDITVLLVSMWHKAGLVTFHGNDVIWGFGRSPTAYDDDEFINRFVRMQIGAIPPNAPRQTIRDGQATGTLIGGNLPCLLKLAGTPYFPDLTDAILFIEVLKTTPARCDHMFHQLKHMGVFDRVAGIVIGYIDSLQTDPLASIQMEDVLLNVTVEYDFPILKINDFGHNCPNTVLPIGTLAHLDAGAQSLSIMEPCLLN